MLGIDTNLVVRYLTSDDPDQSAKARALIDSEAVFVPKSVVLETEWVLRGAYQRNKSEVQRALTAFLGLPTVTVEDPVNVICALELMEAGFDFADTLHLASAAACQAFITFDQAFVKTASKLSAPRVRMP